MSIFRIGLIVLIFTVLSACAPTPEVSTPQESSAGAVESVDSRGIMRVPYFLWHDGKETLDPASPVAYTLAVVMLFDRLVNLAEDGKPAAALASAWGANEDATAWTFTLRENVTFHDGQPLTSADVAYTIERILDPATESAARSTLDLITDIETPDDQTIVFKLDQSHADFPLLLTNRATSIIPAGSADTIGSTGNGTGPFKLESLDATGVTVLSAHDDYWAGRPGLAGVELPAMADGRTRVLAAQSGQVDLVFDVTSDQADLFANDAKQTVLRYPSGRWAGLVMRTDTPPFEDVRVRQALRLVADRQALIDLVLNGAGTVTCDTPVAPNDAYRWNGSCEQDIAGARVLLAEAGYSNGLDVTLYTSDTSPEQIPLAEAYQQQAAAAGINVTLEIVPSDSYWSSVWMVEPFLTTFWQEQPTDQILNLAWRSSGQWNEAYFQNSEFDQLLNSARTALDFEARSALYQEAQQLIQTQGGHLIPFHIDGFHVVSNQLTGVQGHDWQYMQWHMISKGE